MSCTASSRSRSSKTHRTICLVRICLRGLTLIVPHVHCTQGESQARMPRIPEVPEVKAEAEAEAETQEADLGDRAVLPTQAPWAPALSVHGPWRVLMMGRLAALATQHGNTTCTTFRHG